MRKTILHALRSLGVAGAAALALFAAPAAAQTQPLLGYSSWYDVPVPATEYTNQYMQQFQAGQPLKPPNTVYDARGLPFRFRLSRSPRQADFCDYDGSDELADVYRYPVRPNAVDNVWIGARITGDTNPDDPTWDRHVFTQPYYCNSAALLMEHSNYAGDGVFGVRIDDTWDGIRFVGLSCGQNVNKCHHVVSRVWVSDAIDDGIELDHAANATITDSLFDGMFSGISSRPTSTSGLDHSAETITLDGVLMRMRSFRSSRTGADGGFDTLSPFKVEPKSPAIVLRNTIIAFDHMPYDRRAAWSSGWAEVDCMRSSNNLLLWLQDTALPTGWPTVPTCITLKQGAEARMIWQRARAEWIARHPEIMRAAGDPPAG